MPMTDINQLSAQIQGLAMSINEIKSNVKVTSLNLTPSNDCESSAESSYTQLMETLQIARTMNLLSVVDTAEDDARCSLSPFTFLWNNQMEDTAYNPILEYLNVNVGEHAANISHGQRLPHGHFFTTGVYTLRTKAGVNSATLRQTNDEPKLKFNIAGTSDIAVLCSKTSNLSRTKCRYCIEVKRVQDMSGDALTNKALREGVLQLIGLNVQNVYVSPAVIVTNLNGKHFLLSISKDEEECYISFRLNIRRYSSFAQVVFHAQLHSDEPCVTQLFGSPPTPVPSTYGDDGSNDDDECKVQVYEIHHFEDALDDV
jgi:hypothetical protein